MAAPIVVAGVKTFAKGAQWFIAAVGGGVVGFGVNSHLSDDEEAVEFDRLLQDVRGLCNSGHDGATQVSPTLFRFERTESGQRDFVLLEFNTENSTVLVSVTSASGQPKMRRQAFSPSLIRSSYLPTHHTCTAPSAILRASP